MWAEAQYISTKDILSVFIEGQKIENWRNWKQQFSSIH